MMSLLPSTQLLLALWLLAAVAPAATALMNGSVMPFAVAGSDARVAHRDTVRTEKAAPVSDQQQDDSRLDWLAGDEIPGLRFETPSISSTAALCRADGTLPTRASSVLQTDLQRHRPKLG
jgi:hypothetical protein